MINSTLSHLTKDEVSPLTLRFRRVLRQVSDFGFQQGKTGELTPESASGGTPDTKNTKGAAQKSERPWIAGDQSNKVTK
jgi:hypothetical protein